MSSTSSASASLHPGDRSLDVARSRARLPVVLVDALLASAAVLMVAAPMLFTDSGFGLDFTNHLWLTWVAGRELVAAGHPGYFVSASGLGVFDPWFAFYGGTLYTVTGAISELLGGHPALAFVGVSTIAIAGAYGGTLWLGRQLGLARWISHAPALVVITSAYYVTNLYGRGAWPEFMATSAIPPLLASALHLVRAPRWRPWPVLLLALVTVCFTGSHNITLLWGTTIGALAALAGWLALHGRTRLPARRLIAVAGLALASMAVNAWFLLPDVSYGRYVQIYAGTHSGAGDGYFDLPQVLFDPLRYVPRQSTTPALFVQVPDWFLAWALVAGIALLWRAPATDALRRAWIAILGVMAVVLSLIGLTPLWHWIPAPFSSIEFPYRLDSYVSYAVSALVLVGALALQRSLASGDRRPTLERLRLGLALACAVSIGLCLWQLWVPSTLSRGLSYDNRQEALRSAGTRPRSWYTTEVYNDTRAPLVDVPAGRTLRIDPDDVHGDRFAAWVNAPSGTAPIQTNIAGGSYLVDVKGLTWVGRDASGYAVVRRTTPGAGPVHVVIETAHSGTIELADLVSVLACLAILATVAFTAVRHGRSRAHA